MANTTLACLLLLLFLGGTKAFHLGHVVVKSHLLSTYSHYVVAPDLFRNGSFAFATIHASDQKRGIDISVTIADKHSADYCKCSLILSPDDVDNDITITWLKRLSDKKVVLVGFEVQKNDRRKGLLIVLDVKSCETLYLYSSVDLQESHVLVTRESSDKFEIFLDRPSVYPVCANSKSRIAFQTGKKEFHCFEVDLIWSEMFVGAFSFSEDVVMVRGFDDTGTYKILVYNTAVYPYRQQLWLTLPSATNKTEIISSDLAVCWILNPRVDKAVHCSLIEKSGDLRLNETMLYKEPVKLLSVSHAESTSEIILLTETAYCDGADCENVIVSKVSDESISHRTIKLDCSNVDKKRLIVNARQIVSKGAIVLEYVCQNLDRFILHSVNFDDS